MLPQASNNKKPYRSNKSYLIEYSSLAFQLLAGLGLGVFLGSKVDSWFSIPFPLLIWLLPLVILLAMFAKVYKDTSSKK